MKRVTAAAVGAALAEVLSELPASARQEAVRACARFLARKRLLRRAEAILASLEDELLRREGVVRARVVSALPLRSADIAALKENLARLCGAPVALSVRVDDRLLAGFRAAVDGHVVEASLRGALRRARVALRRRTS